MVIEMDFQYFFFDTYIGYFLQALPIAIVVSFVYYIVRYRKDENTTQLQKLWSCIFVCYMTGLVCLVDLLDVMRIIWYTLLYHMSSGIEIVWLGGDFNFIPDFWNHINGEVLGNFLMFLPFGILYPLSQKKPVWKKCVIRGWIVVVVIETLQPIFDRAFDMNDIILNAFGILLSVTVFFAFKQICTRRKESN